MSERQAWRPPVAPKPTNTALRASGIAVRDASPAWSAATSAFSPPSRAKTAASLSSTGAAVAAAAAGRSRSQLQGHGNGNGNGNGLRTSPSPVRGRSQLSSDLDRAARTLEESARREQLGLPHLSRATSEIAARAASSNASPSRTPQEQTYKKTSPQNAASRSTNAASRSRDPSISARNRSDSDAETALLGATMSMSPGLTNASRSPLSTSSGTIDFGKIPSLTQNTTSGQKAKSLPSDASRSAAQIASQATHRRADAASLDELPPKLSPLPHKETFHSGPSPENHSSGNDATHSARRAATISYKAPDNQHGDLGGSLNDLHPSRSNTGTTLFAPIPRQFRTSPRLIPSTFHSSPRETNFGMDVDSLANAMVSASLASTKILSRPPSPSKKNPPPIPRRRSQSLHAFEHPRKADNPPLKPMAMRPMRQTLRKQTHDEDEGEKRGRKHRLRKHPNVHHEGDRKRWRDKVTVKERKRYEGLWAANRGMLHEFEMFDPHIRSGSTEELVVNLVVRDIWERSRLPRDVLEEIWDLVAEEADRSLTREQFVVGLWFVDQRLKGRKLPVKVSPSVWSSVRHTQGVKISSKPL